MSDMQINVEKDPCGLVIRIMGDIGMHAVDKLNARLLPLCAQRPAVAVFDLAGLTAIGSLGLGALVAFHRGVDRCGGRVKIAGAQPPVRGVLDRVKLGDLMAIHATVDDAFADTTVQHRH